MFSVLANSVHNYTIWTQPYVDAGGAGLVTTVARPLYDNTTDPARLFGVMAIDLTLYQLSQIYTTAQIIEALNMRSAANLNLCANIDFNIFEVNIDSYYPDPGIPSGLDSPDTIDLLPKCGANSLISQVFCNQMLLTGTDNTCCTC